jgi:spore coat polysaccharide biosynthesis protein SpsF
VNQFRVILQARTTSTRLPAKALLPLAGIPSAILAARRAAKDGLDLVFATSTDRTDDQLAALAAAAGLKVFRGAKDDVLGRYAAAAADMAEDDVVIRVTGDDPVPDGEFLRLLAAARERRGLDMLFSLSPADGLPHGVAAQAFTVGALRRADREATLGFEREHVGPWLVKHLKSGVFDDHGLRDLGHLRCTLDTLDDYFELQDLFAGVADPVGISWRDLVARLEAAGSWRAMPFRYLRGKPGADPGVERLGALVPEIGDTQPDTIRQAIRCGATHIVAVPREPLRRLGRALAGGWGGRAAPILRLPPPPQGLTGARLGDWLDIALLEAGRDLGGVPLHTVLLPEPARARGAAMIEHLLHGQADGLVRHLGVTVAGTAAARRWLKRSEIACIELMPAAGEAVASSLAVALAQRPEVMLLARPGVAAEAQATVVPLSSAENWAALVEGARATWQPI